MNACVSHTFGDIADVTTTIEQFRACYSHTLHDVSIQIGGNFEVDSKTKIK